MEAKAAHAMGGFFMGNRQSRACGKTVQKCAEFDCEHQISEISPAESFEKSP